MRYRVHFAGCDPKNVESDFPSLAAREVAERGSIAMPATCAVVDVSDGSVTHWRVDRLDVWYARPAEPVAS